MLDVYAEGFTEDWVFPSLAEAKPAGVYFGQHEFTVNLSEKYSFWTFVYLLTRRLGVKEA